MNVFEILGLILVGGLFNVLMLVVFFIFLINKVSNAINNNIEKLNREVSPMIENLKVLTKIFKKGKENV